jgi:hypothetical protein
VWVRERLGSAFRSVEGARAVGSGAAREHGGAWRFGNWQGAWGRGWERGSGGWERGGERASGTLPLGVLFGVRTGGGGGGKVRQPGLKQLLPKDTHELAVPVTHYILG